MNLNERVCEIVGMPYHKFSDMVDGKFTCTCGLITDNMRFNGTHESQTHNFLTISGLYERVIPCPTCKGKGYNEGVEGGCPHCHGGRVSLVDVILRDDNFRVFSRLRSDPYIYYWLANPRLLALDWLQFRLEQVKCVVCGGEGRMDKKYPWPAYWPKAKDEPSGEWKDCSECNGTGHRYHAEIKEIERMREVMK